VPSNPILAEFLAEFYLPAADQKVRKEAIRRAEFAAKELASEGVPVRYLRSAFVPADEICFVFFEADTAETVADLGTRAGLSFDRVVEATT
jgi:hypothetical protein